MKLRLSYLAAEHLSAAYNYLQESSPSAARTQMRRLFEAIDRLKQFPRMGRKGRIEGTRELVVPHTPFLAAYEVRGEDVLIVAILHGSQCWPESFEG